ncbi:cytidylate kinase [Basidiobolus meristosporus CBS 931.73]|uniref:(d)CMP kinase n=1 Tax=Basidiobolus meristosporus CBS 931.73 TaxID=1314790 RepID=A0A1Y1YIW9_9FUNG|nr:cytidylate kinase [Basidiobolus meristosporus CBS 931.73]|eukprot:ORX97696.1 cytidylate kinase [Basidiobolus meristosporus CBS 931.73]
MATQYLRKFGTTASKTLFRVAIDGPAASGKSSTAKMVAQKLGFNYIDSGAMYRSITLKALRAQLDPSLPQNDAKIADLAKSTSLQLVTTPNASPSALPNTQIFMDSEDISDLIRTSEITRNIGGVAKNPGVRAALLLKQRAMGQGENQRDHDTKGIVMDGRDVTTVVFPDAELKIYLQADAKVRAERRYKEMQAKNLEGSYETILKELLERDHADMTRKISPLKKADDAIVVDTSDMTFNEQVERIVTLANERLKA